MLDTVVGTLDEVSLTLGVVGLHFRACERRGASRLVLARRIQHASSRPGKVTAQASQKRVREKKKHAGQLEKKRARRDGARGDRARGLAGTSICKGEWSGWCATAHGWCKQANKDGDTDEEVPSALARALRNLFLPFLFFLWGSQRNARFKRFASKGERNGKRARDLCRRSRKAKRRQQQQQH